MIEQNCDKPKCFWKLYKEIISNTKHNIKAPGITLKINGKIIENGQQIADEMNKFFINVSPQITPISADSEPHSIDYDPLSDFMETSGEEIAEIIKSLDKNCAAGYDGIKPEFLKQNHTFFEAFLCSKINDSIKTRIFPSECKIAKITALFKGGDKHDCNNYRPISVLTVFSKIYEIVIKKRIQAYLYKNGIITDCQFGF